MAVTSGSYLVTFSLKWANSFYWVHGGNNINFSHQFRNRTFSHSGSILYYRYGTENKIDVKPLNQTVKMAPGMKAEPIPTKKGKSLL